MICERDRDRDRDDSNAISTHNHANLFNDVQVSISSSSQKTQRTITFHDFSKTIILQTNFFVSFFKSRVSKILSREFNVTTKTLSRRDLVMTTNVATSRALLTIVLNVNSSRFDIEFVNDEIVERETKNQEYARLLMKKIVAKRIQNLIRLKNRIQRN